MGVGLWTMSSGGDLEADPDGAERHAVGADHRIRPGDDPQADPALTSGCPDFEGEVVRRADVDPRGLVGHHDADR